MHTCTLQSDANYATVTDTELMGGPPTAFPVLGPQTCVTALCPIVSSWFFFFFFQIPKLSFCNDNVFFFKVLLQKSTYTHPTTKKSSRGVFL